MCMKNRVLTRCADEDEKFSFSHPESTCVLHSFFKAPVQVGSRCVIEYSTFESGVSVGNGSIVSNMLVPSGVNIPSKCFFHTVCVTIGETSGLFVTIVFHIKDNVKRIKPISELNTLTYCGETMDKALKNLKISPQVKYHG